MEEKSFRATVTKVAWCLILSGILFPLALKSIFNIISHDVSGTTSGLFSSVIWMAIAYTFSFFIICPLTGKILHIHLLHLWNGAKTDVKNMKYYIPVAYTFSAIGIFLFSMPLLALLQRASLQSPSDSLIGSNGPLPLIISLIIIENFICPLYEEILFRGYFLSALTPYGKSFAIMMSSVLFSLCHGNFTQLFPTFLFGLVLAYVTLETGSVKNAYILHAINNCLTLIPNTIAIYVITAILGVVGIGVLIRKRQVIMKNLYTERAGLVFMGHRVRGFFCNPLMLFYFIYLITNLILSVRPL